MFGSGKLWPLYHLLLLGRLMNLLNPITGEGISGTWTTKHEGNVGMMRYDMI